MCWQICTQEHKDLVCDDVLANMHSEHVSKHHVTHQAKDNKHRNFLFQDVCVMCGVRGGGTGGVVGDKGGVEG